MRHEGVWGSGGVPPLFLTSTLDAGQYEVSINLSQGKESLVTIG
jgi:hypothetical protein